MPTKHQDTSRWMYAAKGRTGVHPLHWRETWLGRVRRKKNKVYIFEGLSRSGVHPSTMFEILYQIDRLK